MNSRDRVLTALRRQEPDRVPYCEIGIDRTLAQRLMDWERMSWRWCTQSRDMVATQ